MCDFVSKDDIKIAREAFESLISKVRREMKEKYHIKFSCDIIGSGKRRLVIKQCNRGGFFDLDYQITLTKLPKEYKDNIDKNAKKIKMLFKNAFDKNIIDSFSNCEDSTQALTITNKIDKYGFDIIIVRVDENDERYILYNKKNTNNANNNDYCWEIRSEELKYRDKLTQLKKIKKSNKWKLLRECYKQKRHNYKDKNDKKSYQILNEAINEII